MNSLPGTWAFAVRGRLRALRVYLGVSVAKAAGTREWAPVLTKLEGNATANIYLDQLQDVAKNLGRPVEHILCTWEGGHPPAADDAEPVDYHPTVRENLHTLCGRHGVRSLARDSGLPHTTLLRWCSGEYQRIDLVRLERIARAVGLEPVDLVLRPLETVQ